MAKLIAFRMPDDRLEPFEAWCALNNKTTTAALIQAVDGLLNPPKSVLIEDDYGRHTTAVIAVRPGKPIVENEARRARQFSNYIRRFDAASVQLGPSPSAPGSRLKSDKKPK